MRLAAAWALAGVVAAAGLAAAPSALPPLAPGPAAAADCVPVQHSKKVVKRKKVRRKGRIVKVKRKRIVRWTTCEPAPPPPCPELGTALGVTARDVPALTFTLSRPCVSAGTVSVQLQNDGEDPHTLALRPAGAPDVPVHRLPGPEPAELDPGLQDTEDLELSAGEWYLWCDLPGHEGQGMNATLQVR